MIIVVVTIIVPVRHYEPALGRFFTVDPYRGITARPSSFNNKYIYMLKINRQNISIRVVVELKTRLLMETTVVPIVMMEKTSQDQLRKDQIQFVKIMIKIMLMQKVINKNFGTRGISWHQK